MKTPEWEGVVLPPLPPEYIYFKGSYPEDIDILLYKGEGYDHDVNYTECLVAWVDTPADNSTRPVRIVQRNINTYQQDFQQAVASVQAGVDVLVQRLWLGMTDA